MERREAWLSDHTLLPTGQAGFSVLCVCSHAVHEVFSRLRSLKLDLFFLFALPPA